MAISAQTDEDLARSLSDGLEGAAEELLKRHFDRVFNLAFRVLRDEDAARDACQEGFLRAFTRISTFRFECTFSTWLYRIALNAILAQEKREGERDLERFYSTADETCHIDLDRWLAEEYPDESRLSPEERLLVEEVRMRCVLGMLMCLERDHRAIFVMRATLGLPSRVIAEIVGESNANVRKILSRATARLSAFLSQNCGCFNPDAPCRCARTTLFRDEREKRMGGSEKNGDDGIFLDAVRDAIARNDPRKLRAIVATCADALGVLEREPAFREFRAQPELATLENIRNHADFAKLVKP